MMLRVTDIAHLIVRDCVQRTRVAAGVFAIDATVGNGHDTRLLAEVVGPVGRVFGFDIQANAIARTRALVGATETVQLFHVGHEHMAAHVPADATGNVTAIMFNLGYLPGAAKDVTTRPATTLAALRQAFDLVAVGGVVTVIVYPGHPGGLQEADAVRLAVSDLPKTYAVHTIKRHGGNTSSPDALPPELLVIERLTAKGDLR
jgi:predicted methyltransferase